LAKRNIIDYLRILGAPADKLAQLPDGEIRVCDTQLRRGRDQIQIHKFFLLKPGCLLSE
jgi:hypothetical protein